ncbi:MAG TPA: pectinesterase family protein [Acidobacteriaceae bacterium]|nr:pectinesterase family protein [Acidobacteriaceae bacterium]
MGDHTVTTPTADRTEWTPGCVPVAKRKTRTFSYLAVAAAILASAPLRAQDVHVRVSPDLPGATADNTGFPTIQMALDHAPQPGPGGRLYIEIAPGIYHERVFVTQNRPRTTLMGTGADPGKVVVSASQNAKSAGGTFFTSTVQVSGDAFQADNLTFENTAGNTGQAVAITVRSDRAIFKHCRFLGDQDTLFSDFGRQYFLDSYIQGGVDFIFGNAAAVFESSEIHIIRPGYLTAQSRVSAEQSTGYVFHHDRITAEDLDGRFFYLGRPWRPFSRVVFLDCVMPASLSPQGWSPWTPGSTIEHTYYAERGSDGPGANVPSRLAGSRQLTAAEAKGFATRKFLAGTDHWDPIAEAARLP